MQPSGELIATGETLHVICDHLGRPKSLPEKYRQFFPPRTALQEKRDRDSSLGRARRVPGPDSE